MSIIKKKIADGVNLNIIKTEKFKTNYISVNFIAGLDEKSASLNSLLPAVLKRGTESYPSMEELNKKLDMLYAANLDMRVYKRGETQIFGFGADVISNEYTFDNKDLISEIFSVIEELIFKPFLVDGKFKKEYVETEKQNLIDHLNAKINNKVSYARTRCQELMCSDEIYSVSADGKIDEVEKINSDLLYDHYNKVLKTYPVEIFFVGNCDTETLEKTVGKVFSHLKNRNVVIPAKTNVIKSADSVKEFVECEPVNQGKLTLGFRLGQSIYDGEFYKFTIFNELFGASATSKLFLNVREKLSLCYYCSSLPESYKGIMIVSSGIENVNKQAAQDEILKQLDAMKNGEFSDSELDEAKKSAINKCRELTDSASSLEIWYLARIVAGVGGTLEELISDLRTVNKKDVTDTASKITLDTVYFMKGTSGGDK